LATQFDGNQTLLKKIKPREVSIGKFTNLIVAYYSETSDCDLILGMDWVTKTVMNIDFEKREIVLNQETLVENVTVSKDEHEISSTFQQFYNTEKKVTETLRI
jgi:Retroviral aspartyl protease